MDTVFFIAAVAFFAGIVVGVALSMFVVLVSKPDKPDGYRPDVPFDNRSY